MSEDPPRWTTGDEAPEPLRRLLATSRAEFGTPGQLDALALSLSRALGPSAGLGADALPQPASRPWLSVAHLRALSVATVFAGAGALWWALRPAHVAAPPSAQSPAPALTAPAAPVPQLQLPTASPTVPALPAADPAAEPKPSVSSVPLETEPSTRAQPRARQSLGPSEAALLERARAALREHPEQALALTREHQRRYPHGALREEREVIAIEALQRLGKHRAASDEAGGFGKRYRNSVHRERLEQSPDSEPPTPLTR